MKIGDRVRIARCKFSGRLHSHYRRQVGREGTVVGQTGARRWIVKQDNGSRFDWDERELRMI